MLHQMLISPFISFHSSPPPSQLEKEKKMEFEPEQELPWDVVEKGNTIFGEEFVDEFLDLGGLTETEKELDGEDDKDNGEREKNGTEEEDNSAVSFEPPPPVSELAFPSHDVAELEWVSRLMDDSEFPSCSVAAVPPAENKPPAQETSSAVPVPPEAEVRVRAKRSKRNRSPSGSWSNWGPPDYSTSSSSTTTTTIPNSSSSCPSPSYSSSSPLIFFSPLPKIPKKRGRKPKPKPKPPVLPSGEPAEENRQYYRNSLPSASVERRCSHCGVNKTPQWRAGPMGAKTLCNACGVRYKSGRLLPEYRPACSPTFVSHVHSNSHRKVLEMRRKKEESVEENQNDSDNQSLIQLPVPSF